MTDFNRPVHCILGLPIDAVDIRQAAQILESARTGGPRCFLSTPNLNFVIASLHDSAFRESVCRSDLSLADGMPLVWVARLLGIPVRERVSGSGLFDFLRKHASTQWNIFFFGGQMGMGQEALLKISTEDASMHPTGYIYPGFGNIEQMSHPELIECINESGADMLVVSLGAAKGQAWICRNFDSLNTPVISHLGAVINFVAGTVYRAPVWMQHSGLEWLWRIKEEPALYRRYVSDGMAFLRLMMTRILPLILLQRLAATPLSAHKQAYISHPHGVGGNHAKLTGAWNKDNLRAVRDEFSRLLALRSDATLDLADTIGLDSAFLGLVLLLNTALLDCGSKLFLVNVSPRLQRLFRLHSINHLNLT